MSRGTGSLQARVGTRSSSNPAYLPSSRREATAAHRPSYGKPRRPVMFDEVHRAMVHSVPRHE